MTKILKYIFYGLLSLNLLWFFCRLVKENQSLMRRIETMNHIPDTVYVDKPYLVKPQYKFIEIPKLVTCYFTDTTLVERVILNYDTLVLVTKDSLNLEFNTGFLTQFPDNPKLIQALFSKKELSLILLNSNGRIYQNEYELDFDRYSYNYTSQGGLTKKKVSPFKKFKTNLNLTYRPIHTLVDFQVGLQYNTTKFTYELGPSLSYYPQYKDKPFIDLYLKFQYNF